MFKDAVRPFRPKQLLEAVRLPGVDGQHELVVSCTIQRKDQDARVRGRDRGVGIHSFRAAPRDIADDATPVEGPREGSQHKNGGGKRSKTAVDRPAAVQPVSRRRTAGMPVLETVVSFPIPFTSQTLPSQFRRLGARVGVDLRPESARRTRDLIPQALVRRVYPQGLGLREEPTGSTERTAHPVPRHHLVRQQRVL